MSALQVKSFFHIFQFIKREISEVYSKIVENFYKSVTFCKIPTFFVEMNIKGNYESFKIVIFIN